MSASPAIAVQGLHKRFGDVHAVQGISFAVQPGEIYSLLGPNGAGKSTTISMICCLLRPDEGDARVLGHSVLSAAAQVKAAIGVVPQDIAIYPDLSARENLTFWGRMYGLRGAALTRRVDEVLDLIGLTDRQKGPTQHFSGGMKRRLNIGIALLHTPQVVIMDEPTVGIDPQSRRAILDSVKALNAEGMTVLYTTHYMEEAEELSHRIAIMDHGKIIAEGAHEELVRLVGEVDRIDLALDRPSDAVVAAWRGVEGVRQVTPVDGEAAAAGTPGVGEEDAADGERAARFTVLAEDSNLVLPRLFEASSRAGVRITSVQIQEPNLESVFLHLTGRALRD